MDRITAALHHRADVEDARPAVTPLFQASAFQSGSKWFYSRKDNPNVSEWETAVAMLEGAKHGVAASTGMAAISLAMGLLAPGDTLVVNKLVYGCSHRYFQRLARAKGLIVEVLDLTSGELRAIPPRTKMVFFETPTNPFLRTVDIRPVVRRVKLLNPDALVVVDNTWATPLFQRPLALGADLSIHSATKFLSGHSDVMGGIALTDRDDLAEKLREERFYAGAVLDPHAAWLLRRSLQTLEVRMRCHQETTWRMRSFLQARPQVERVFHPNVDGEQLTGYGGILFFQLREDLRMAYPTFAQWLTLFTTGTGMAAVTSMVAQPWSGSHASMTPREKRAIGLDEGLVRLCFGLEDAGDLERDLLQAFAVVEVAHGAARRVA